MCTGSQWRERVVPRLYDRSMIQRHGAVLEAWESGLLPFSIIMAISSWRCFYDSHTYNPSHKDTNINKKETFLIYTYINVHFFLSLSPSHTHPQTHLNAFWEERIKMRFPVISGQKQFSLKRCLFQCCLTAIQLFSLKHGSIPILVKGLSHSDNCIVLYRNN